MPRKTVLAVFLLALLGSAIYVYFTFPRTRAQMPASENQRPFPSAPGPNNIPPDTVPRPTPLKPPTGPTLHVMTWASGSVETAALRAEADAYQNETGHPVSWTINADPVSYRHDVREALESGAPPDLCLVDARDFAGLDPRHDFVDTVPARDAAPRAVAAFTFAHHLVAVPAEFSVDLLYYNPAYFDQAGIAYPDRHWNWDILEAISRALASLQLKSPSGDPVYPLELPADFDFWNILCSQAGHPALETDTWHLAEKEGKESQLRALDFLHQIFCELAVTAPAPKTGKPPGHYFEQQQAVLLIAPSNLAASLPFRHAMTVLPQDMARASLARINGWAVTSRSNQPEVAADLARYLARQPIHSGWTSTQQPSDDATTSAAICRLALDEALVPRLDAKSSDLAHFLDQQIGLLTSDSSQTADKLYARIQDGFQQRYPASVKASGSRIEPKASTVTDLRSF